MVEYQSINISWMGKHSMSMYKSGLFDGKTAFVTGAGQGIGQEIATTLAELGADVAVNDIYEERAEETVQLVQEEGSEAIKLLGDVSQEAEVEQMISKVEEELGTPQLVVNNAGANSASPLTELSVDEWDKVMAVNTTSTFLVSRTVAKSLAENDEEGSIVNLSSVAGLVPQPGAGAYTPSKASIIKLTQQMAIEWAEFGIRVNAVCPGMIWTPATDNLYTDDDLLNKRRSLVPIGEIGEPSDVAESVVYLLSPTNGYTTGEILSVDGGLQCAPPEVPGKAEHE
ncbi:SDR family oxidoreductase [Natronomonas salsuginis]|uniref:SDR family oxidoreductase n=2 Tax=Natronomonas salsuginis TaxID=2217661 RepID=A0A4U5JG63_9EURY|nr:SDR family oxidoreductase [Natronomonas salsuginis]